MSYLFDDPFNDPGDSFEPKDKKWDFPENGLVVYYIQGYPYKVNNNENVAKYLHYIRTEIDRLVSYLVNHIEMEDLQKIYKRYRSEYTFEEFVNGFIEFIDIHSENERPSEFYKLLDPFSKRRPFKMSSRYLLSEMPKDNRTAARYSGINKPKARYESDEPSTGIDGSSRATYRDIFLDLKNNKGNQLINLLLHELAHSMSGDIRYREEEAHRDAFKQAEYLLHKASNEIKFLRTK